MKRRLRKTNITFFFLVFEEKHESRCHTRNPSSASAYEILPPKTTSHNQYPTKDLQQPNNESNTEFSSEKNEDAEFLSPQPNIDNSTSEKPSE